MIGKDTTEEAAMDFFRTASMQQQEMQQELSQELSQQDEGLGAQRATAHAAALAAVGTWLLTDFAGRAFEITAG